METQSHYLQLHLTTLDEAMEVEHACETLLHNYLKIFLFNAIVVAS